MSISLCGMFMQKECKLVTKQNFINSSILIMWNEVNLVKHAFSVFFLVLKKMLVIKIGSIVAFQFLCGWLFRLVLLTHQ